jgi:hypothetical protein
MKINNRGKVALSEIMVLIIGMIAFSWMIGVKI